MVEKDASESIFWLSLECILMLGCWQLVGEELQVPPEVMLEGSIDGTGWFSESRIARDPFADPFGPA